MEGDRLEGLRELRGILRQQRRESVAAVVDAKMEPRNLAPLVDLQQACDAAEWALDDEAEAAKEREMG